MNIAIIGAGNVGGALGGSWARAGHRISFGVRDPAAEKTRALLASAGASTSAALPAEAARGAEVVVLATPWDATEAALAAAGDLHGKVLVDCTNPLKFTPGVGLELALGFNESGGERVAGWAAGARVVKAFNTYGWENFANPRYPNAAELKPVMFLAGDAAAAKATVGQLATDIGFEPFDAGALRAARELEPLALIWIRRAFSGARNPHFTWARLTR
ncbi:MAG: NAD(P)-binding domain-containing protein [Opitutaceae bacterium]|nr:NAD(P)-binding domain-containing protein [Opitutaceae bacterium]